MSPFFERVVQTARKMYIPAVPDDTDEVPEHSRAGNISSPSPSYLLIRSSGRVQVIAPAKNQVKLAIYDPVEWSRCLYVDLHNILSPGI